MEPKTETTAPSTAAHVASSSAVFSGGTGDGASGASVAVDGDRLLQASRRLDWRFLLSTPVLGNVAYVGRTDKQLLESLQTFSASLTIIDSVPTSQPSPASDESHTSFDVVVGHNLSVDELRWAAHHVRNGGWLYLEERNGSHGWSSLFGNRSRDDHAILEHMGFVNVRSYWHWPDFTSCKALLDRADRTALRYFIKQQGSGGGLKGRLKGLLGRGMLNMGMLGFMQSCCSVVAQRETT